MVFEAKLRKVGSSLGVLVPKEEVKEKNLREGETVEVAVLKRNAALIDKMFGSVKIKKFKRDHSYRVV